MNAAASGAAAKKMIEAFNHRDMKQLPRRDRPGRQFPAAWKRKSRIGGHIACMFTNTDRIRERARTMARMQAVLGIESRI